MAQASDAYLRSFKVAIIGAGFVGSTTAYALMLQGISSEIALIDINKEKADGEALDLQHCLQFTHATHIVSGSSFDLVKDASVVVITAGKAQSPGETRTNLLEANVNLFKTIIPKIVQVNKDCIILVVTNPLDVLTYVAWKLSGFPSCRVLGAGTVLDTARLRFLIGQHFDISPKDITAHILGEHGDSEFIWKSHANIAGVPLSSFAGYSDGLMNQFHQQTKNAAYQIINKKGATYYAIALVVAKIVRAIMLDQSRVFTVSSRLDNYQGISDVCLSVPTIVRRSGVCQQLELNLSQDEKKLFATSAEKVAQDIKVSLKFLNNRL